jgi:D-inositol-3-phosphate glycosyltransferase
MVRTEPSVRGVKVLYVEPVGGHRGMHYYDFALCRALVQHGVQPTLVTCDETQPDADATFAIERAFVRIYGSRPAWQRGLNYARGLLWVLSRTPYRHGRIVHLHYFHVPLLDLLFVWALKRRGFAVAVTAHDVVPFDAKPSDLPALGRIYRLADRVIVHTVASKEELTSSFGVRPDKAKVVHQGPYPDFAGAAAQRSLDEARLLLGLPMRDRVILFFGQIKRVKGLDTLIRSFDKVLGAWPNARLVIAGPVWKDDYKVYADLIETLQLGDRVVTRLGYIPDDQVPAYFQAADVVALPYRKVYQSAVLFMAHSFARPVVATAVGGLAEVIQDGETGWLVSPEDEDALAAALCKVLADASAAERVGLRGRRWVLQHYSWSGIARQVADVYDALVRSRGIQGAKGQRAC